MLLSLSLTCFASKRPLRHLLCQALRFVVSFVDCHFAPCLSLAHLLGEVSPSAASYDDGRSADLLLRRLFAESYLPSPTGSDYTHMIGPTSFDYPFGYHMNCKQPRNICIYLCALRRTFFRIFVKSRIKIRICKQIHFDKGIPVGHPCSS